MKEKHSLNTPESAGEGICESKSKNLPPRSGPAEPIVWANNFIAT